MKRILPAVLLLTLSCLPEVLVVEARGQSAIIRGAVTEESNGQPMAGVNVVLYAADELVTGSVSNADGLYALAALPAGRYVIRATFVGFRAYADTLDVSAGARLIYNIELEQAEGELDEIVVQGEQGAGIVGVAAGHSVIRPADIEMIPSPDISGDLINYLTTLPGIVTVGDRGGQLFVRGGEPWQNLVLLDGMWVYQPFHILGFFSSFPTDIVQEVDVYAGGYTSEYGGRISSVMDVKSRNGDKRNYGGNVSLAPFVSGVGLNGPIYDDYASFILSYRRSVIGEGASRFVDDDLPFEFGDFFAKVHGNPSSNSQLSVSLLRTFDEGTIFEGNNQEAAEVVSWRNRAASARYLVLPRAFPVMAEFVLSLSRLTSELGPEGTPVRTSRLSGINTTVNVTHFFRDGEIQWGLFARTLETQSNLDGLFQGLNFRREYVTEVGLYLEPRWRFENGLEVQGGLRVHSFPSKEDAFVEPRVRIKYPRLRDEFSFAFGTYHQEVIGISDRRDAASVFTAWTAAPREFEVPEAIHFIGGYRRALSKSLEIGVESYYKILRHLFIPEWTAFPRFTTRLQPADGRVVGADVRIDYQKGRVHAFTTYGLSSVRYEAQQESLELWYGTSSLDFRPGHDRRHQVNAVLDLDLDVFQANVRWQFGSGLPFSRALGFDGFILLDGNVDVFRRAGSRRVIYEEPYQGVLPTYHRLDITIERSFAVRPDTRLKGLVGLINVYDRTNLFYLDVFTLRRVDQLPIIPTFGMKLEFE
ncbi:MAG: TonB-dependent receptor [Rhodothermales bacterium]|nr:TonB-dependent receptor [Rhodothermales bacterium]